MDEPPSNQTGKKSNGLSLFMSHTFHIPRGIDELYSRLLFFFFTFLLDGRRMSRPLGINARSMWGTCHQEDQTDMRKLLLSYRNSINEKVTERNSEPGIDEKIAW